MLRVLSGIIFHCNLEHLETRCSQALQAWLTAYAQIYFSRNRLSGLCFMVATFVVPEHGVIGLLGLISAEFWAWACGSPSQYRRDGYYGFNGLLTGLALGLYYHFSPSLIGLLLIASLLTVVIATAVRTFTERYFGIPALSLTFIWVTWISLLAARRFVDVEIMLESTLVSTWGTGILPAMVERFLRSLAAAFFQVNLISGILVFVGLICFSRWAAILAAIGFSSGFMIYTLLGGGVADLDQQLLGFNFILSAVAVGGVWLILQPLSLILAIGAGGLAAVLSAALLAFLDSSGLPVLAMPFVLTTQLLLFTVATRTTSNGLPLLANEPGSPETNLDKALHKQNRFGDPSRPTMFLPFFGRWRVTQGHNGEHTHQELWRHAWDFEIMCDGSPYRNNGTTLDDYYSFLAPVVAPADGRVVRVIQHLEDNPVGEIDVCNNWGNLIILWHSGDVYSVLCHLAKGSVMVEEGEIISSGQMLARVGNSGRSPVPHLHFHLQRSPEIGAPTCPCEFVHYLSGNVAKTMYQPHGIPITDEEVCGFEADIPLRQTINRDLAHGWSWKIEKNNRIDREKWSSSIDLMGKRRLTVEQTGAAVSFYSDNRHTILVDFAGNPNTLLKYFFLGASRIPYIDDPSAIWFDQPSIMPFLNPFRRVAYELCLPFMRIVDVKTESRMEMRGGNISLTTKIHTSSWAKEHKELPDTLKITFSRNNGPIKIKAFKNGDLILKAIGTRHASS